MLQRCSSSPRLRPLRSAPSTSSAVSCRLRSSCAGCSQASPTTRWRGSAPGLSPAGSRCRCGRRSGCRNRRGYVGCAGVDRRRMPSVECGERRAPSGYIVRHLPVASGQVRVAVTAWGADQSFSSCSTWSMSGSDRPDFFSSVKSFAIARSQSNEPICLPMFLRYRE
jgi:hypothetical protein